MNASTLSFFAKHEFLIRRLHSLSGLIPVGAYMTVHLLVNASLLNGVGTFQTNVNQIHSLGKLLPLVEWSFIFLPLIFHAAVGVWIVRSGKGNTDNYRYTANWRYTLQRWSGVIAVVFIFTHVFHLHGWFHSEWWLENVAHPLGMANFRAYNASSTLAAAIQGTGAITAIVWPVFYALGIVACVFHLANGIWTMGITWGVWVSPHAQKNASYVCSAFGVLLLIVGMSALGATMNVDVTKAKEIEDKMYESKVETGEIIANPEKRSEEPDGPQGQDGEEGLKTAAAWDEQ